MPCGPSVAASQTTLLHEQAKAGSVGESLERGGRKIVWGSVNRWHGSVGEYRAIPALLRYGCALLKQSPSGNYRDAMKDVVEPKTPTEFEVQAYVWGELRKLGVNARGEVKTRFSDRCFVRFDVAIFEDGRLKQIIEIKRQKMSHKTKWEDTRQGVRYNTFSVPVTILYGMDDAVSFLKTFQGESNERENLCGVSRGYGATGTGPQQSTGVESCGAVNLQHPCCKPR